MKWLSYRCGSLPFQKLLSYELDVQVGIYEAKYHRDELMTDRKTLSEELKNLKESLDDNGPPSKVRLGVRKQIGLRYCSCPFNTRNVSQSASSLRL